jgi:quercetin dioxygenase-like cupin family protein
MSGTQRENLDNRILEAPILNFSIDKEIAQLKKETEWINGDRNAVTLQKNSNLCVVLLSLHKGAKLLEHTVDGPITLFVISGKIKFACENKEVDVESNGLLVLEKKTSHDVEALEDSTFILTVIQTK